MPYINMLKKRFLTPFLQFFPALEKACIFRHNERYEFQKTPINRLLLNKKNSNICPRNCKIERETNKGFCLTNEKIKISKVMLHHYEEPIISGIKGSGAVFWAVTSVFF